jgi:DNA-binding transcriptional regulator WhiA
MDSCVVIDLILEIREIIRNLVLQDVELASSYIKGLMAGEGTVYNKRSKYVRIEMKNPGEINYVKKLLNLLGIKYTHHIRSNRKNMENLYIGGKDNIKRYYELIGFGSHKKRQKKLKELVESYN